jgi:long-chain acyl-CoA synthetase
VARDTIVDRLINQVKRKGSQPAFYSLTRGRWQPMDWKTYGKRVRQFAGALVDVGCEAGDKVNICGYNCAEWVIADVGAMFAGCVPSGIYHTDSPPQIAYIANHSEARVLVIEDLVQWEKILAIKDELETVRKVVMIRDSEQVDDDLVISFEDFLLRGEAHEEEVDARIDGLQPDALATMIYTSGTTGPPKGVMLSNDNLSITANMAHDVMKNLLVDGEDCVVSYLPLSHIAEQMFTIHLAITLGYPVYFAPSIEKLKDTLIEARPTLFFAVPRVWEKFQSLIEKGLNEATGPRAAIIKFSRATGLEAGAQILTYGKPQGLTAIKYEIARKLFFSKVAGKVGLDRLKIAVSAAAPITQDTLEFFMSLGIIIREIYGQSEGSGRTTFTYLDPGGTKIGAVGKKMPRVDVKIAEEDGEILVKGPNVFMGYYKNPEATAETLIDGWLHSGDIGEFDSDGFLRITDRKKNIIIPAGGHNVAPAPIEGKVKGYTPVSQCVMIGDLKKHISALITLDPEAAPAYAGRKGWPEDLEALATHGPFLDELQAHVDKVNALFDKAARIKKFRVLPQEFTEENGELTPTKKIKRRVIHERYADLIDEIYAEENEENPKET